MKYLDRYSLEFSYLIQLIESVDGNDMAMVNDAIDGLDELRVPFDIVEEVHDWAADYGALRKSAHQATNDLLNFLEDL